MLIRQSAARVGVWEHWTLSKIKTWGAKYGRELSEAEQYLRNAEQCNGGHRHKKQYNGKAKKSGGWEKHPIPAQKKLKGLAERAGNLS